MFILFYFKSNVEAKKFMLVDFGLAQSVDDIKLNNLTNSIPSRAGTRGFRAPEGNFHKIFHKFFNLNINKKK